jgi:hypothetical protein
MLWILNLNKFIYDREDFFYCVGISNKIPLIKKREMCLERQNYAIIIPNENSCIKFDSNKIDSLQRYDTTQNFRILHRVVQRLSHHKLKILYHRHIQKLRQVVIHIKLVCPWCFTKQNFIGLSGTVHELHKIKSELLISTVCHVCILVFCKGGLNESSSFKDLSALKI